MSLSVIILAAGNGKRMHSAFPKVLHRLGGLSLLEHVVKTVEKISTDIYVVYGFGGEQVRAQLANLNVKWVLQKERLGTGHAVLQALPSIPEKNQVLVLVGDIPLVSLNTLQKLIEVTLPHGLGLITTTLADPTGFGRIVHDDKGELLGIIEHKDATPEQKKIKEINSGIIIAPAEKLKKWLPNLENNNAQAEYYLTDIIALAVNENLHIHLVPAKSSDEVLGVNDRAQLAHLERLYQRKLAENLLLSGVTLMDPNRLDIRGPLEIAEDSLIDINVILEGKNKIGRNTKIGPQSVIKDSVLGENVNILSHCVIEGATIDDGCTVGPFARLRPGTHLKNFAKVGNFVEVKNSQIGDHSKANHLSYIGDAIIGQKVNVGCGTVTCNYDGVNKYKTIIEDGVFIGSGTQLVAPIKIGQDAIVGAGSTLSHDAPPNKLTLSRAKQVTIENWKRKAKK